MGWTFPWYSSAGNDFNRDFGVTTDEGESFGLSVFLHDDGRVFRSYFTASPEVVYALGGISYLDLTPLGQQGDM